MREGKPEKKGVLGGNDKGCRKGEKEEGRKLGEGMIERTGEVGRRLEEREGLKETGEQVERRDGKVHQAEQVCGDVGKGKEARCWCI